jgi:inosose dehydratase
MNPLAFSTPTHSLEEQRELFRGYRAAGFGGLQLKASQYLPFLHAPAQFQEEWGMENGAASGLICGNALDAEGCTALRRIVAFASAIGSERVIFCHGLSRQGLTRNDISGFADLLSELGAQAQSQGVALSLHHHYDQPVMTRDDLREFFDIARPGTIGLTLDTAHLVKSGVLDVPSIIREFGASIDNVHVKDFSHRQFVPLGQGEIQFAPIFAALQEIGYAGWLCADEESGVSVTVGLRDSAAFFAKYTEQIFE